MRSSSPTSSRRRSRFRSVESVAALACVGLFASACAVPEVADEIDTEIEAEFTPLSGVEGDASRSSAHALSADGEVVVGAGPSVQTGSNGREALAWDAELGLESLGSLSGGTYRSRAHAVSGDGREVVGESSSEFSGGNSTEAFLWLAPTEEDDAELMGLGDLPGGSNQSIAYGVSRFGDYVVGESSSAATGSNASEAFLWIAPAEEDPAEMIALGSLPGGMHRSVALGVSAYGEVVVGSSSSASSGANGDEAFRVLPFSEDPEMEGLGSLPGGGFSSWANAVSLDGSVIVGASSSANSSASSAEAFRWTEMDGLEALGDLPGGGYFSEALAVSYYGDVIVGVSNSQMGNTGFIWDRENGMRSIVDVAEEAGADLRGWRFMIATGVSSDGTVMAGTGINPLGVEQGWVIRFVEVEIAAPVDI